MKQYCLSGQHRYAGKLKHALGYNSSNADLAGDHSSPPVSKPVSKAQARPSVKISVMCCTCSYGKHSHEPESIHMVSEFSYKLVPALSLRSFPEDLVL